MEKYTVEFLANEIDRLGYRETLLSVKPEELNASVEVSNITFESFTGTDIPDKVWVYPRTMNGLGVEVLVDSSMTTIQMVSAMKEANSVILDNVGEDNDLRLWFGDAFDDLMFNIRTLLNNERDGVYVEFLKDTKIKHSSNDNFIVQLDDGKLTVEANLDDLYEIPRETTLYRSVISLTSLWEIIQLNAFIENKLYVNM